MNNEDKILSLVKAANPEDPVLYVQNIVKNYAIDKIYRDINNCNQCDICNYNKRTLPHGDITSNILMIGEAVEEDQFNGPCKYYMAMSKSMDTLKKALNVINADPKSIYYTNSVNCYPGKESNGSIIRRMPFARERANCKKHLDKLIDALRPDIIITLGAISTNALTPTKVSIIESRGIEFDYRGYRVMPTFHPEFFEKCGFEEELVNTYKELFLQDLFNAFTIAKENPACKIGNITI